MELEQKEENKVGALIHLASSLHGQLGPTIFHNPSSKLLSSGTLYTTFSGVLITLLIVVLDTDVMMVLLLRILGCCFVLCAFTVLCLCP